MSAGPRFGYFNENTRELSKYFLGVSAGYSYNFNVRNIFRISIEAENSLDFQSNLDGKWREPWVDMFIEPGIGVLLTRLLPFALRMRTGFSYRFTRISSVGVIQRAEFGPEGSIQSTKTYYPFTSTTHKYGIFLNPGIFLMRDRWHIGMILLQRFHSGKVEYEYDDPLESPDPGLEVSDKMGDFGFEGGLITGRFSHSLSFFIFRINKGKSDRQQVASWNGGPGNLLISYQLAIPIPLTSKKM